MGRFNRLKRDVKSLMIAAVLGLALGAAGRRRPSR